MTEEGDAYERMVAANRRAEDKALGLDDVRLLEQVIRDALIERIDTIGREVIPMYDRCMLCGEHVRWMNGDLEAHECHPSVKPNLVGILADSPHVRNLPPDYLHGSDRLVTTELLERCHAAAVERLEERDRNLMRSLPAMHPNHAEFFIRNDIVLRHSYRFPLPDHWPVPPAS